MSSLLKISKRKIVAAAVACSIEIAMCQVRPPSKHGNILEERADAVKCAVVVIQHENTFGTGFFTSYSGDIVTASHVLGERSWSSVDKIATTISLSLPTSYTVSDAAGHTFNVSSSGVDHSSESWGADIAMIRTGHQTDCWLDTGDDSAVRAGDHVITMGFPSLSFQSVTLYEGIVSVPHLVSDLPLGKTVQGAAVMPQNEVFRVQMPVSPGLSGSPLLNDKNKVIGVINAAGAWNPDFDSLNQVVRIRNQQRNLLPGQGNNRDLADVLAELLDVLHNYNSPGYGDATPMRYLKKAPAGGPTLAPTSH